jgi:hypothetical protein
MICDFPHTPPQGYTYKFQEFNSRLIAIWLCCHRKFDYNLGKSTKTIWGFYSHKKKEYYAPVNAKTPGAKVKIEDTRDYTAMQISQTPLEKAFL